MKQFTLADVELMRMAFDDEYKAEHVQTARAAAAPFKYRKSRRDPFIKDRLRFTVGTYSTLLMDFVQTFEDALTAAHRTCELWAEEDEACVIEVDEKKKRAEMPGTLEFQMEQARQEWKIAVVQEKEAREQWRNFVRMKKEAFHELRTQVEAQR